MPEIGIRLTGLGGQGIVLSSVILGRAASVYDHLCAVQTQTYGSDMRGGDVCTEVIISEDKIIYPTIKNPDILIALAQKLYDQHIGDLKEGATLITDSDLVKVENLPKAIKHYKIEFNKKAIDSFGENRASNMILLGFLAKKTGIISSSALKKAIHDLVSPKIYLLNEKAVDLGIHLALK